MIKYTIKRILALIPMMLILSFLVFCVMSSTGDPAMTVAGDTATAEEIELLRAERGWDDPIVVQYWRYITNVLTGNLGQGIYGNDVWEEFSARIGYTLVLACVAMMITVVIALPLGIIAAVKQNTWVDSVLSALAMGGIAMPIFWLGLMMIILFAVELKWLPTSGAEGWTSIIMPAFCAGISNASLVCRMTRSSMVDYLHADFLRTARAKGVSERRVVLKHAMGNALIPIITIVGSQFSILMGGTVVVESVFAWPGVGAYLVSCIRWNDSVMVTSFILLITVFIALVLLGVDILYAFVDPRIKARYTRK